MSSPWVVIDLTEQGDKMIPYNDYSQTNKYLIITNLCFLFCNAVQNR